MKPAASALPPVSPHQDNIAAGLLLALCGFALLSVGDSVVKSMAGQWPGTAVAALRYTFGFLGLTVLLAIREGRQGFRCPKPWVQIARGVSVATGSIGFFLAIYVMPLADATAISFVNPVLAALFSFAILKEKPPAAIGISILLAFAGVLVILKPNVATIGWNGLLPLVSAVAMALLMVFNRMAAGLGTLLLMQWLISGFAMLALLVYGGIGHVSGIPSLHIGWPSLIVVLKCAVVAVSATTSHLLIFMATERASAGRIAPMTYVQLLVALLIGYFVYNNAPDIWALGGAALIIGGGLVLWRMQVRSRG
jgi:drug/metabolite transporter (DMT)-like permease